MKNKKVFLTALTVVLLFSVFTGTALAYFTANAEARGAVEVNVGPKTHITEPDVVDWVKHVEVANREDSKQDVFVRARAYSPSQYPVSYSGDGWTDGGDGWWYYETPLKPGESTSDADGKALLCEIHDVPEEKVEEGTSFNVTVVYEATPVQYNEDGTAFADWNYQVDDTPTRGGN